MMRTTELSKAVEIIRNAKNLVAFTGAGISVASSIPPFRGKDGLWSRYDPKVFDIDFFMENPQTSWKFIKEIFYGFIAKARPNPAHYAVAKLNCPVITQNIDNLHQEAGSLDVVEFHGSAKTLTCIKCNKKYKLQDTDLSKIPPGCANCGGVLKPDFVFFKEPIPETALSRSIKLAQTCDVMLVIGTTGEIMPASQIPWLAKQNRAAIVEVNISESSYTQSISDIFLQGKAEEILPELT